MELIFCNLHLVFWPVLNVPFVVYLFSLTKTENVKFSFILAISINME